MDPRRASVGRELARAVGIEKRYGDSVAVRPSSCQFRAGEIHAVCGENGAGKSTLLRMVCGLVVPDAGSVELFGTPLVPFTPREAIRRGAAMVLQHFALVPVFTALENVVLGAEAGAVLDLDAARGRAEAVAKELGVSIPWDAKVETLGVGDRQRLEIARALFRDATLVVLDEPTAVLTKVEAGALYATLRRLADAGRGIVVVTHKMDEVRTHADVVTVMRKGEVLFTRPLDRAADIDAQVDEVARAIMGGASDRTETEHAAASLGEVVVEAAGVSFGPSLEDVSFSVRAGEVVGIAGVEGNGQRELVLLLSGVVTPDKGRLVGAGTRAVVREDRQVEGLVLDASLEDNLLLGELEDFSRMGILDRRAMTDAAEARLSTSGALEVRGSSPSANRQALDRTARSLSGGNQQKIAVTRALSRSEKLVVAAQPTRGVDLGASQDIHARLRAAALRGAGVVVLSADLDELRAVSSRILVLARGRLVAELPPTASDEEIGRKMLGIA